MIANTGRMGAARRISFLHFPLRRLPQPISEECNITHFRMPTQKSESARDLPFTIDTMPDRVTRDRQIAQPADFRSAR
jgi:hypothetical protein